LSGLAFTVTGLLITFYRPGNRVGWILMATGSGLAATGFLSAYLACHFEAVLVLPGTSYMAWINHRFILLITVVPMFILMPFLYPTGSFLSPGWRRLCLGFLAAIAILGFIGAFAPDLRLNNGFGTVYDLDSPVGWVGLPAATYQTLFYLNVILVMVASLAGIASMVSRLRRSSGVERQQMKWFTYFLSLVALQLIIFEIPAIILADQIETSAWNGLFIWLYSILVYIVFIGFPLTIALAIFRYRLYDIDIIINRTLVYGLLTLFLLLVYFGSVVVLQSVFTAVSGQQSPVAIVISTLVIAAIFNPLRRRIQDFIDRRFFRRKYDAAQTLAQFALTARDEVDLDQLTAELVRVVEETMRPETLTLWLKLD
jgi:hypothetical protein